MVRASRFAAGCLLLVVSAQAQNSLLQGFTFRVHGGLDHLAGLEDLNDQIHGMNAYFGEFGNWVEDAQGENFDIGQWAPYLKVPDMNNRPDMGFTLERTWINWPHSRLIAGLEFTSGNTASSNLFSFSQGQGFRSSIFAEERVEVQNTMLTCRYSLKDLELPLHAHVGMGLGLGSITTEGRYMQQSIVLQPLDPLFNEVALAHSVIAEHDGDALTARLFVGAEWDVGPMSLMLDLGYNHMNFDELEGSTTQSFRGTTGEMEAWEFIGAPDTRFEFAPYISAALLRARDNARAIARGQLPDMSPVDLNDPDLHMGAPEAIAYDLSGGYARFSIGYRF